MKRRLIACATVGCLAWCVESKVFAQSSSLYGAPEARAPLSLEGNSWTYLKVDAPREMQLNDIITVIVSENSQVLAEGAVQRRAQNNADLNLQNWIGLDGFGIFGTTPANDPRVRGQVNSQYRTTMSMDTKESVKFTIAARVVDVRPNGTLVIEAHDRYQSNHEVWEQSLSGIIRREDILPNNTVMSEDINELSIYKREKGHVRDAYRRGWLLKILDQVKPF
ncbi:MAG: flagellar basal body L-ring protein FlgH [Planctomycetes bacterium]|nr:flagellar basal body L-ring protein FlgH [Planctomycetota bacterium]